MPQATTVHDPTDTVYSRGLRHLRAGQHAEAEACFRAALAAQPDHAEAHHNLGLALRRAGREAMRLWPAYLRRHESRSGFPA